MKNLKKTIAENAEVMISMAAEIRRLKAENETVAKASAMKQNRGNKHADADANEITDDSDRDNQDRWINPVRKRTRQKNKTTVREQHGKLPTSYARAAAKKNNVETRPMQPHGNIPPATITVRTEGERSFLQALQTIKKQECLKDVEVI